jgi:hypothetical protein
MLSDKGKQTLPTFCPAPVIVGVYYSQDQSDDGQQDDPNFPENVPSSDEGRKRRKQETQKVGGE